MSDLINYGFEVRVNGEQVCKAGIDTDRHVVTCILTSLRRAHEPHTLDLAVSGLNSVTGESADWIDMDIKHGDTITIKVIASDFDPAQRIRPSVSKEKMLADKLNYYHKLKEELKEYLE